MENPIKFHFRERKAAQAAARLLLRHGGPMQRERLVGLLYLADRRALLETGYPTTGDDWIAGTVGPALRNIAALIAAEERCHSHWSAYVAPCASNRVIHAGNVQDQELSEYDCELLDDILDEYGGLAEPQLRAHLERLPECRRPSGDAHAIDPREVLLANGFSPDHINDIAKQADALRDIAALSAG